MPSTSPAWSENDTSFTSGSRVTPCTSRSTSPRPDGRSGTSSPSCWPTMCSTSSSRRGVGRQPRGHGDPLGEHGDPVADPTDLVEPVGDVHHADPVVGEAAHDLEQGFDLGVVEHRGGLVHDQEADVVGEGSGDRDHLLAGRPHAPDENVGRDGLVVDPAQELGGLAAHAGAVEEPRPAELVAEEDVLGHREVLDEVELLVDGGHPSGQSRRRITGRHRLAARCGSRPRWARPPRRCT